MTVRLSDAFIPEVYGDYSAVNNPKNTAFWESGVIANNETLDNIARSAGKECTVPFWNDLDATGEPNYSNDDPADMATPDKVTSGTQKARKAFVNKGYADMDLVQELAGSSPMQHIRNRFGRWWQRQFSKRLISTVTGVYLANVAKNSGDMTVNISAALDPVDQIFNKDAFIDATYTMGEDNEVFGAIAVHSAIAARMEKNDETIIIPDSQGRPIRTYRQRRLIVDDAMPILSGTGADRVFLSVVMGSGAIGFGGAEGSCFAYGEGTPRKPFEIDRAPRAGNGGGMEEIWERNTWLLHPGGFQFNEADGAAFVEFSPDLANLATAAYWTRVVSRANVPLSFIVSKA